MLLRLIFVAVLVLLFVVPIYNMLKRRTTKIKSEMEDAKDVEIKLLELKTKEKQLKQDCKEEIKQAEEKEKHARKVSKQL